MPLDGRRTMLAGKLDGGLQEGRPDAGSPVPAVDHEARHPPDSGILLIQHSGESPVAAYPGKPGAESYPGPSDRMGGRGVRDLLVQRVATVWWVFSSRGCRVLRAEEDLTPAPRRIFAEGCPPYAGTAKRHLVVRLPDRPPSRLPAVSPAPQRVTLFAPFAMNTIMNDGRGEQEPQPKGEDEAPRKPVLSRDAHSKAHVGDEQPRSERNDQTDLGLHQVAHVRSIRGPVSVRSP
jgi:hypothetical protein